MFNRNKDGNRGIQQVLRVVESSIHAAEKAGKLEELIHPKITSFQYSLLTQIIG